MDGITLTTDKETLAKIMRDHRDRCISYYAYRRMQWALAWHYLQGIRNFKVWDPMNRRLIADVLDDEGRMEHVGQELLKSANEVAGVIQGMDLRPKVDTQGSSLDAQRSRAIAQVFADATINDDHVRTIKARFAWNIACLGFCGLYSSVERKGDRIQGQLEIVHPRELFPFPLPGEDVSKVRGLFRIHYVTKAYLEEEYGKAKVAANLDKLEWWESMAGNAFDQIGENESTMYWTQGKGMPRTSFSSEFRGSGKESTKDTLGIVRVMHLWLYGDNNTVSRYVCASGGVILQDEDLRQMESACPISYARFMEDGTFHGQGMFDLLFSTHRKSELLDKFLANSTLDLERFPITLLPQGQINQNQFLQDVGRGLRVAFWEPDPTSSEGINPVLITPFNPGDVPGRVAQYMKEGMRNLSPVKDLLSEKGRVESAAGLAVLQEQMTQAMTVSTGNIVDCWGQIWKSIVQKAAFESVGTDASLPVNTLTLDLAGAVIKNGRVSFPDNPLPDLSMVSFTIRSVSPKNTVARKEEAYRIWQLGIETDPIAFKLAAHREGFDLPLWMEEEKGAHDMAVESILTVFNDGETPGELVVTPYTTRPEIFLRVFNGFITGPIAQKASVEVINALGQLRNTMIDFMGLTLPNAIPNPDDAAMLSAGIGGSGMPQGSVPALPPGGGGNSFQGGESDSDPGDE